MLRCLRRLALVCLTGLPVFASAQPLNACVTQFSDGVAVASNCAASAATSLLPLQGDRDGCFNAVQNRCLKVVSSNIEDGQTVSKLRNTCQQRVYARYCHGRINGAPACGGGALEPGEETLTYTRHGDGRICAVAVGSVKPANDFHCRRKEKLWSTCANQLKPGRSDLVTLDPRSPAMDTSETFLATPEMLEQTLRYLESEGQ